MSNENVFKAVGRVNSLSVMTIDAYGVAVKNGFEGTAEEWLESLHATDEQVEEAVAAYMAEHPQTEDVVLYTKQDLTEEQKAQARENIGVVPSDESWTLVDSVVTEEEVTFITIPMGDHKITSKDQQMLICLVTPPNNKATGMLNLSIYFNDGTNPANYAVPIFVTQSHTYGGIEHNYKIYSVYETKFIRDIIYTNRIKANYGSLAYPQPSYGALGSSNGLFGTKHFDCLNLQVYNPTVYPSFPIGTEVYVYVK